MKLLGKIIILIFITLNLYSADAYVSKRSIILGEKEVLILRASGSDITFPTLNDVSGFPIISTGSSQNIEYVNGKMSKTLEKQYAFLPTESFDITSYEIIVDGKSEKTSPLHVEIKQANMQNSPFTLSMSSEKSEYMQFEAIPLVFTFKIDPSIDVRDLRFSPPKFDNFWVKEGKKSKPVMNDGVIIHKIKYFLFPQVSGTLKLGPAKIDVGIKSKNNDIFSVLSNQLNWKSVISNPLTLHVKKIDGAKLYGKFDINLSVDKKNINKNSGVNVSISINGYGNFDDIDAFKLNIKNANIYADKPTITTNVTQDKVQGKFSQKFSISSDKDFIIPSVSLSYFDAKTKQIVTKKTKPIRIKVIAKTVEKQIKLEAKSKPQIIIKKSNNYLELLIAFFAGIMLSILVFFGVKLFKNKSIKIPSFKNDKDLLKTLLMHRGKNKDIDINIVLLEENIYANKNNKIDKKKIKEIIKSYEE